MARALAHQSALKKEQDEVSRLKAELEKVQSRNAELEKNAAEEKQLRVEETRKLKETLEESGSRASSAEREVETLKANIAGWVAELATINGQLNSKHLSPSTLTRYSSLISL